MITLAVGIAVVMLATVLVWAIRGSANKDVVVALAAIAVSIFVAAFTHQATAEREIREAHRLQKVQVYTDLVNALLGAIKRAAEINQAAGSPEEHASMQEELTQELEGFVKAKEQLLLWGAPGVITEFHRFNSFSQTPVEQGAPSDPRILLYMDDLLRAVRRDLDLKNEGLERGDLIKLLLSNPQELDQLLVR